MIRMRRLGAAILLPAVIAGMTMGAAGGGKKPGGGDSQAATCAYLWSIITYPYVSPTIQQAALAQYYAAGCSQ